MTSAKFHIVFLGLKKVLFDFDRLESQAKPFLESTPGKTQQLSSEAKMLANSLMIVTSELRDFVESLKPPSYNRMKLHYIVACCKASCAS